MIFACGQGACCTRSRGACEESSSLTNCAPTRIQPTTKFRVYLCRRADNEIRIAAGDRASVLFGSGREQQECEDAEDQRWDHSRQFTVDKVSAQGTRHHHH